LNIEVVDLLPIGIALSYGIGYPMLMLLVVYEVIKQRDFRNEWAIHSLCAYLIPIVASILYLIVGRAIYPERSIIFLGLYISLTYASLRKRTSEKVFYYFAFLTTLRVTLWVITIVSCGGFA